MSSEQFEKLAREYPDLMQKSQIGESLDVGEGWYDLIDTLCELISRQVANLRTRLRYSLEKNTGNASELEIELNRAIEELPVIVQVKEKFGGLRFYIDGGDPYCQSYITFAESMSHKICEQCGDRGSPRHDGWVKVRCDKHQKEFEEDRSFPGLVRMKIPGPKLSDEDSEEL